MLVPLGGKAGDYAVVDAQDAEEVGKYNWTGCQPKNNRYPYALTHIRHPDGTGTTVHLHRLIAKLAGFGDSEQVDHVSHDGLDCRRSNLRPATRAENNRNKQRPRNNTSGFKGVGRDAGASWRARIRVDGKLHHLGRFDTPEAAAKAYDQAAVRYFGQFASLNFPQAGAA